MISDVAVIILAAGKGTRMKSDKAKVLHEIAGTPMVNYVVSAANEVAGDNIYVVVGHQADSVKEKVREKYRVNFVLQKEQLGTGHAVMCAVSKIHKSLNYVVILCGDTPLISPETIKNLITDHISKKSVATVLAVRTENPYGYGRVVISEAGGLSRIVEQADADEEDLKIDIVNSGIYCVNKDFLAKALRKLKNNNSQGEYYLTDIVSVATEDNQKVGLVLSENMNEAMGINTLEQLEIAKDIVHLM